MIQQYFGVAMAAVFILAVLYGQWRFSRLGSAPRQMRQRLKKTHLVSFACAAVIVGLATFSQNWMLMGLGALSVVTSLVGFNRQPREGETVANWVYDRGKCGRCDYDLTYVDDPTRCPECGWMVPASGTPAQRADWALWWKRWTIDHLDRPRQNLYVLLFFTFVFCVLTAVPIYIGAYGFALIPAFMAIHLGANTVRVVAYLRHHDKV